MESPPSYLEQLVGGLELDNRRPDGPGLVLRPADTGCRQSAPGRRTGKSSVPTADTGQAVLLGSGIRHLLLLFRLFHCLFHCRCPVAPDVHSAVD